MWFSLLLVLLPLLTITYFHAIQGLFSALLSAALTILCVALAFATYEYIAVNVLAEFKPNFALGLSLMIMFIVPLIILRVVLDQSVHRSCLLPLTMDKAGGFVFGVITAYLMVGMMTICIQLMPFGNTFLHYSRVDREDPTKDQQELWLQPDRFTAKLASMMSDGIFSGEKSFSAVHPDFVTEIGWIEGVVPIKNKKEYRRGVRRFAPPGSMSVTAAWEETYVYRKTAEDRDAPAQYEPQKAEIGSKFIRVLMQLRSEAQDADNKHRFTLFQTRLVGDRGYGLPDQYHAMAVADAQQPDKAICDLNRKGGTDSLLSVLLKPDAGNQVDVVFEVPMDFQPRFVEYKSGARETITLGAAADGTAVADANTATTSTDDGSTPRKLTGGGDRVSGVAPTASFFGDSFPNGITMTAYRGADIETDNAKQALKNGHIHGAVDDQGKKQQRGTPLSRFAVPSDKRLLHLNVKTLKPGSIPGKALNLAVTTMKNYLVTDSNGRQYRPIGAYILGRAGVVPYVEIQYFPEWAEITGRGVYPWARLKENRLWGEYTYVFLYLVDPGVTLVRFSTGGGGTRAVDLGDANLTAPK